MTDHVHDERRRAVERALEELRQALLEIGAGENESLTDRCPYRMADDTCTYEGGCRNRIAKTSEPVVCGGDHQLNRSPAEQGEGRP